MGMMILASAVRHRTGRPAMGMEGGMKALWSGRPAAVCFALEKEETVINLGLKSLPQIDGDGFLSFAIDKLPETNPSPNTAPRPVSWQGAVFLFSDPRSSASEF